MKEKEIDEIEARNLFDDNGQTLRMAELTSFCSNCFPNNHNKVELAIEKYFLDDLGNLILEGKCQNCGQVTRRLIEKKENVSH